MRLKFAPLEKRVDGDEVERSRVTATKAEAILGTSGKRISKEPKGATDSAMIPLIKSPL